MNETTNSQFNKLVETYEKFAEALREENPNVTISKEEHQKLVTERLAFGFDSIYFRYAAVVDELARYKAKDGANINVGIEHFYWTPSYQAFKDAIIDIQKYGADLRRSWTKI